jgi:hypothetical protein
VLAFVVLLKTIGALTPPASARTSTRSLAQEERLRAALRARVSAAAAHVRCCGGAVPNVVSAAPP